MSQERITTLLTEKRSYLPPEHGKSSAWICGQDEADAICRRALEDPNDFWGARASQLIHWFKRWDKVLEADEARHKYRWFTGAKLNAAFATLPKMAMTPRQAYEKIVANEVEMVPSGKLMNRISANSIIPYPPGIPMLMSGENFGGADSPQIGYLKSLEDWDHSFPGFEHVTEGTEVIDGIYHVMCVK